MIDEKLLIRLAQKYDDLDASDPEAYRKCMENPDCRAKMMAQMNERKRLQRERDKLDPTRQTALNVRRTMDADNASRKALRESGTLDGIAYKLGQQLADIKRQIKNKLQRDPGAAATAQKYLSDVGELYHLRNKIIEFAETLRVIGLGQVVPAPEDLLEMQSLAQGYLRFPHFKGVTKTIHELLAKLKELAITLVS